MLNRLDLRGVTDLTAHLPRPAVSESLPLEAVREILADVAERGDEAVLDATERFDGVRLESLAVDPAEIAAAAEAVEKDLLAALVQAEANIASFHESQRETETTWSRDGIEVNTRVVPVRRAGCYVPGGRAPLASTLLMTAVPARVAGVDEVAVCVPPDPTTGKVAEVTLAAAAVAGVSEVYAIGGAQAIGAMAHGTDTVAPVDVIAGPGNIYVATAKREVAGVVGIAAAFAGPSEIVVVADSTAPADLVAVDLAVQAEHGPDGLSWLITWDPDTATAVADELAGLVSGAARRAEIEATLATNGWAVVVDGPDEALEVADAIAGEHLQFMCEGARSLADRVRNAGAVFCGPGSPASFGDYAAGPSHVLPTHGSARFGSALTVADFTKHVHVVEVSDEGFDVLAGAVERLAVAEGLEVHARSVSLRRERRDAR